MVCSHDATAFYPRQVIVRLSDFKANEYASLIGGELFEPDEENPMIGFRGAYRYPSKEFHDCFAMECKALKSVQEGECSLELLSEFGLTRGESGLNIFLMC